MRGLVSWLAFAVLMTLSVGASAQTPPSDGDAGAASVTATPAAGGDGGAAPMLGMGGSASPDAGEMTGEQYLVRLRDLEQRINELKEEIFRSKARLSLLAESVLQNTVGGSRALITHQNEMGASYRLVSAVYALDGAPILTRNDDSGRLADERTFQVFNGQIGAGDHSLGVTLQYIGAGLPYMKGYQFRVRSTQSFSVPEGKAIQIRVVAYEKGGPFEAPENRPAIRYVQRVISLRDAADLNAEETQNNAQGSGAASGAAAAPAGGQQP